MLAGYHGVLVRDGVLFQGRKVGSGRVKFDLVHVLQTDVCTSYTTWQRRTSGPSLLATPKASTCTQWETNITQKSKSRQQSLCTPRGEQIYTTQDTKTRTHTELPRRTGGHRSWCCSAAWLCVPHAARHCTCTCHTSGCPMRNARCVC